MEEHEVHSVPLIADAKTLLSSDEREVASELQQEGFHLADEPIFDVALRVLILQTQELEQVGIFDLLLRRDGVL